METPELIQFLAALGIGSALTAYITGKQNQRLTKAEASKFDAESESLRANLEISINQAALDLVNSLRVEVKKLSDENATFRVGVEKLSQENATLKKDLDDLRKHVGICQHELGIDPAK